MNNRYNPGDVVMFTGDAKPYAGKGCGYEWTTIGNSKLILGKEYVVSKVHHSGIDFTLEKDGFWYNENQFSKINYKEGDYVVCVRESNAEINGHIFKDNNLSLKKGTYCVVTGSCGSRTNNTLSGYWLVVKSLVEDDDEGYICPTLVEPVTQEEMVEINKLLKIKEMEKEVKIGSIIKDHALNMYVKVISIDFSNAIVEYVNNKGTFKTSFDNIEPFNFIITGSSSIKKAFVDTVNELKLKVTPPIDILKESYTTSYFVGYDLFHYDLAHRLGIVRKHDSYKGFIPLILPRDWDIALTLVTELYSVSEKEKALSKLAEEIGRVNGYPMTTENGMTDKIYFGCREFDKKSLKTLKEAGEILKYIEKTKVKSCLTTSGVGIGDFNISYEIIDKIINTLSD